MQAGAGCGGFRTTKRVQQCAHKAGAVINAITGQEVNENDFTIDNYDSFSCNRIQLITTCKENGEEVKVIRNDELTANSSVTSAASCCYRNRRPRCRCLQDVVKELKGKVKILACVWGIRIYESFGKYHLCKSVDARKTESDKN